MSWLSSMPRPASSTRYGDAARGVGLSRVRDRPGRREVAFEQTSTLLLPVDNAEYQLQVLSDRRSSSLMHSATTRDGLFTV